MIPESFIQELLSRIDIVEVINKVSPLKRTGKNFMCCCPFHKEKTPSFSVSQQKQFFKCFGCGASGNVIGFLMRYEGLSYPEAIRKLAESIGMTVPEAPREREQRTRVRSLTDMMKAASDYYCASLRTNTRTIEFSNVAASRERQPLALRWAIRLIHGNRSRTCSASSTPARISKKKAAADL